LVPAIEARNHPGAPLEPNSTQLPDADERIVAGDPRDKIDDDREMAMQGVLVQLRAAEAQLSERAHAVRKVTLDLVTTSRDLAETTDALAATRHDLDGARAMVQQTTRTLDQTRATLHDTEARLNATSADLSTTRQQLEQLSNSGRLFIRQYLPKLRRHLSRRLLRRSRSAAEP
jgi:ABC-type transporter Mla subunit MlaD